MAPHSSILAWRIPWTEEPGGLLSMGSHRVEHDWSNLACMHACIGEGNGNPLQYFCLENPRGRRAWLATVYGVTQSRTQLKQLTSSSSRVSEGYENVDWEEIYEDPVDIILLFTYTFCQLMAIVAEWVRKKLAKTRR